MGSERGGGGRVWIVSELYYPEETSTGYILTRIAEHIARSNDVGVLCSQPTYRARGTRAPTHEVRAGVEIERLGGTTLDKNSLVGRTLNMLTITSSVFLRSLQRFRRGDLVIVVTNPPLLPFLTAVAARLRRAKTVILVHDVYPEVLVASGMTAPYSLLSRLVGALTRQLYRHVDGIVAIGRDMERLVRNKLPSNDDRVVLITNWADIDSVVPQLRSENPILKEHGLLSKVVLQYAGNMGRSHDIEGILAAAKNEMFPPSLVLLFAGDGAKRSLVQMAEKEGGNSRIRLLPSFPREKQSEFLNACDVAIISFVPGMAGVSVPSRMYNILAAGKPILAIADPDSELALVIRQHSLGWVVAPGNADALMATLHIIADNRADLLAIGARARMVAEQFYAPDRVLAGYERLVTQTMSA